MHEEINGSAVVLGFDILHMGWDKDNKGWITEDDRVYTTNNNKIVEMMPSEAIGCIIAYEKATEESRAALTAMKRRLSQSEEIRLKTVQSDGLSIAAIDNPSEDVKRAAVKENGFSIKWIDNPSEELQIEAVREYWEGPGVHR